jgi:8-oxo-dGTP pyrophosphatase MutT (NUDIX family)
MSEEGVSRDALPRGAGSAGEVPALPAASTITLRGESPFEVLMMRRSETSTFVPGAWVFPGGAIDESDRRLAGDLAGGDGLAPMKICALRELLEEAGVWPGPTPDNLLQLRQALLHGQEALTPLAERIAPLLDRFVWTSRWVTPIGVPKRYDTWFFLLHLDRDEEHLIASPDEQEAVEITWITPAAALARYAAGDFPLVFPTLRNLEAIASAESAGALVQSRIGAKIPTIQPVIIKDGAARRIVILDEP